MSECRMGTPCRAQMSAYLVGVRLGLRVRVGVGQVGVVRVSADVGALGVDAQEGRCKGDVGEM